MATITVNYKTKVSIPFAIKQADGTTAYDLTGKRVTWSAATANGVAPLLKKDGGTGSIIGGVTITAPATNGAGTVDLTVADFASLPSGTYATTLWVDSGTGDDTVASQDTLTVSADVSRT